MDFGLAEKSKKNFINYNRLSIWVEKSRQITSISNLLKFSDFKFWDDGTFTFPSNRKNICGIVKCWKIMKNKQNDKKFGSFLSLSQSAFDDQLGKALPS